MRESRVLLVEDDKIIQKVMSSRLRQLGCSIEVAASGIEALMRYQDNFHIIFLDLGLPDMSGVAVCEYIRAGRANSNIPIIVTTAWEESKEACLRAGVDDFALKPVSRDTLGRLLKNWLPDYSCVRLSTPGKY